MLTEAEFEELAQRAEIERLRGDVRVARNELALERESYEQMHDVAIRHRRDSDRWAALAADATARADEIKAKAVDAIECAIRAEKSERARAEKAEAALSIEREASAIALRAEQMQRITAETRADRYLAAMRDAVRAYDRLAKGGYGGDLAVAWATLRAIVEEARRG